MGDFIRCGIQWQCYLVVMQIVCVFCYVGFYQQCGYFDVVGFDGQMCVDCVYYCKDFVVDFLVIMFVVLWVRLFGFWLCGIDFIDQFVVYVSIVVVFFGRGKVMVYGNVMKFVVVIICCIIIG